jgi:hypothetical protein
MTPPIGLIQKRIANTSVGTSTVRGQPKGTAIIARKQLQSVNLKDFSDASEDQFTNVLDAYTEKLKNKLPSNSWGIARKVLNIFLFQAAHDVFLNRNYTLDKITRYLEVPLDNPNAKKLKKIAKSEGKNLYWKNIYSLVPETSNQFQEYARKYAYQKYNCERCYLDIFWWRSENDTP